MKKYRQTLLWQKDAKYYYYSYKNEEALPYCIFATIFCLIFFLGFGAGIPFIWLWYAWYCDHNNKELDKDARMIKERRIYERYVWNEYHEQVEERGN